MNTAARKVGRKILRRARRTFLGFWLQQQALYRTRRCTMGGGRPHGLPAELIISLTSFPPRFPTLALTLRSLLCQSVSPDRLILWIAEEDIGRLPASVLELRAHGLTIEGCEDLRSFKKLVPSLMKHPESYIVTADDDSYYPTTWLERLVSAFDPSSPAIICHRAHEIVRGADGRMAPYRTWKHDITGRRNRSPSDILPTTGHGVLYPAGSLGDLVTEREKFQRLCPDGDDLWFYWCARMHGTPIRKTEGRIDFVNWSGSQTVSLWNTNSIGGNDRMIQALEAEFGPTSAERAADLPCPAAIPI